MKLRILAFAALSLTIFSCSKEDTASSQNSLVGDYKFVSVSAQTESDVRYSEAGTQYRDVTTSAYTSTDNKGTIKITADKMESVGLGYTVSTTATVKSYEDGVFVDSFEAPFNFTLPTSNSTVSYKLVTADSISYQGASIIGGISQATAGGSKFYLEGNNIILKSTETKTSTQNVQGIVLTKTDKLSATTVLQKQ